LNQTIVILLLHYPIPVVLLPHGEAATKTMRIGISSDLQDTLKNPRFPILIELWYYLIIIEADFDRSFPPVLEYSLSPAW
jgi:hypothetical protein